MQYWLLKTDPKSYSIDNLATDKETVWDGVRNYQARNNLKLMKAGDTALIYHSVDDKMLVGSALVIKEYFPDPKDENWVAVLIQFQKKFKNPVALSTIKAIPELSEIALIKQSRLSVMPLSEIEYNILVKLSERES